MAVLRFEPFRDPFDRLMSLAQTGTRAPLGMPLDIYRTQDGNYHIDTDLPGVRPGSIDVTVEHNTLTIKAERAPRYAEKDQVIAAERPQGSFTRQLALGEGADTERLSAEYADGVLHVTVPAVPRAQARRVEVTHARGAGGGRPVPTGVPTP
jgi:HSP20 family protein